MLRMLRCSIAAIACVWFIAVNVLAAEPKTSMTERGNLLFADDFAQAPGKQWKIGIGKWELVDGVLHGSEQQADKHGAVMRHFMSFHNVVIQYAFKLDGAAQTTLSIDGAKGQHCCRAIITPSSVAVRKDMNADGPAMILDRCATEFKPGQWHTIVAEVLGKEVLARLEGDVVAFGSHESIDVKKTNFFLTVSGASASFKDLRVWEGLPSKSWETTKAKLLESRAKTQPDGK